MGKLIALAVKAVAEGRAGARTASIYWWLAGKKTYFAAAIGGVWYAFDTLAQQGLCEPCAGWASGLLAMAGILATIGIVDGAVRVDAPKRPGPLGALAQQGLCEPCAAWASGLLLATMGVVDGAVRVVDAPKRPEP